ncbi:MAG TPA: SMI1/KNR4 family protein [Tepidisphaeraceae bacterium]|jgi:hypothetical protein
MVPAPPEKFAIGHPTWTTAVRRLTDQISTDYWQDFQQVSEAEIVSLEATLNRRLPNDLRQFLMAFGRGSFTEFGGDIYSPDDMIAACPGPMWMLLGSVEWASDEAHRRYYISRGQENPDPARFTAAAMNQLGVPLLDLLQIGTNGSCGYLQVNVGNRAWPFGYCVLQESEEVDDKLPSFSDGLYSILIRHWRWHHGIEDDG